MSTTFVSPWRVMLLVMVIVTGFGAVLGRLVFLHVYEAPELAHQATLSRQMILEESGRRGDILDSRGNVLATTRPRVRLGVDPQVFNPGDAGKLAQLAAELGLDGRAIAERVLKLKAESESQWVKLAEIDPDMLVLVKQRGIAGVYGNTYYERFYPAGDYAGQVIGFVNREGIAAMGVEQYLDFYLQGQGGWKETEVDVRRREMAQFRTREVEARSGFDVEMTIDLVVQGYVEDALERIAEKFDPAGASIIVSDPHTGDILALGNYPSLDLNAFGQAPLEAHRNRAVSDLLEPGSTFKIVPVAAALEENLVSPLTKIDCGLPVVEYHGRRLSLPDDTHENGIMAVSEIVTKSSNRGSAQLGLMLGEDRLYEYARKFGFGESTDWALMGEVRGTVHPVDTWDSLTITRMPIGYALNATPMQVHLAMSAVANGGHLRSPRILRRIVDHRNRTVVEFSRHERGRVMSERNAALLTAMLATVPTDQGTARRAAIPGFQVAGKTGTARKIINGRYSHTEHFGSFSGFFPANAPQFAITVVVDQAKVDGIAYGGTVAAPTFREIGKRLIEYYAMNPPAERPTGLLAYLGREATP
jgi:cell division protein FtsI (penicillin-binding protein 3)